MRQRTRFWMTAVVVVATLSGTAVVAVGPTVAGANAGAASRSVVTGHHHVQAASARPHSGVGSGYDLAGSDGGVFAFPTGGAQVGGFFGSLPQLGVDVADVVGITPTDGGGGYDLVGSDGGVFAFPVERSSGFYGSLPGLGINVHDIVGIVPTNNSTGYDLVGADGGVFSFPVGQTSGFFGSLAQEGVSADNIVGMAMTADDKGYWLLGADGTVHTFGDARFHGGNYQTCAGGVGHYSCWWIWPSTNFVGMAPSSDGKGYWLVLSGGQVMHIGDAPGLSLTSGTLPPDVVSIVPTDDGNGYWLVGSDGGIASFGDAPYLGSLPDLHVGVDNVVGAVPTAWAIP